MRQLIIKRSNWRKGNDFKEISPFKYPCIENEELVGDAMAHFLHVVCGAPKEELVKWAEPSETTLNNPMDMMKHWGKKVDIVLNDTWLRRAFRLNDDVRYIQSLREMRLIAHFESIDVELNFID